MGEQARGLKKFQRTEYLQLTDKAPWGEEKKKRSLQGSGLKVQVGRLLRGVSDWP